MDTKIRPCLNRKSCHNPVLGIALLVLLVPSITLASIDAYFSLVDDPEGAIIQELNEAKYSKFRYLAKYSISYPLQ